jgi:alpha/beta superfamily hydrolase
MRAATRRELIAGPVGQIECAIDLPERDTGPRGVALIAHPHPLYGGTLDNKVVQTLARCFVDLGYAAIRPNFRGVGETEGQHDEGRGELEDLAAVLAWAQSLYPGETGAAGPVPPVLAGFSFGSFVQTHLAERVTPERMVLVGVAVKRFDARPVPGNTMVIHGEEDETVPLADVLDWARPQDLPVVVVPGADHFFHQRLQILRSIVQSNWATR